MGWFCGTRGRGSRYGFILSIVYFCVRTSTEMQPSVSAPFFDGKGEPSVNYAQQVELWRQAANLGPVRRDSAVILFMETAARDVCMAAGNDVILCQEGAETKIGLSRN